jgi:Fe-S cluster assembly protein SufD
MKHEAAVERYREHFNRFESGLNGGIATPLHETRRQAIHSLEKLGFPTLRQEDWRYTNLGPLLEADMIPAHAAAGSPVDVPDLMAFRKGLEDAWTMVFVDGVFSPSHSDLSDLPEGLTIESIDGLLRGGSALPDDMHVDVSDGTKAFPALNAAFLTDGAVIRAARGFTAQRVIHLLLLASGSAIPLLIQPRIHIHADDGSELRVVETHGALSDNALYCSNLAVSIHVGRNARLEHVVIQQQSRHAYHIASLHARIERDGTYSNKYFGIGSKLTRNEVAAVLADEHSETILEGLYLPAESQHMDHFTVIDHATPNCESHELYKGILSDNARAVFSGRIIVRQDAQKTNAKQSNKNLLLSDDARINTKPQLEIYADDVKCTHGATVGQLDDNALFYLRSRGISETEATAILSYAFAAELVERVSIDTLRPVLRQMINTRLDHGNTN